MRTLHLFAGIGGGLLADLILGHTPVAAIEQDEYCCTVLQERALDGWFPGLEVVCADVRTVDFSRWAGRVDCIAAGFPCQDISAAGRGAGIDGERSGLWREVIRAIDALRPACVFLENSPNIRTKGRHVVIGELVARGYAWRDGILAAADVGAGHIRKRWWCLAADADRLRQLQPRGSFAAQWRWSGDGVEKIADADRIGDVRQPLAAAGDDDHGRSAGRPQEAGGFENSVAGFADTLRDRSEIAVQRSGVSSADRDAIEAAARYTGAFDWAPPDAGLCGMVDGVSARVQRIKGLGNAQVPLAAAAAWIALGGGEIMIDAEAVRA
jgi:DNA (cytosine-5)-methyltransferase 1